MADSANSIAMRRILAFAQEQMPESIFCIISFTQVEDNEGTIFSENKIATNCSDRESLVATSAETLANFLTAPVMDLTDTVGGMQ